MTDFRQLTATRLSESIDLKQRVLSNQALLDRLHEAAMQCCEIFRNKGRVLWCGNGGSAADAQHLAAEFSGRYYFDRPPLDSDALHVNTSYLTAVANDYSYDEIYARLVRAQLKPGDMLIGLSTSGNSPNVVRAFEACRELGATTVGFTGESGGKMRELSDLWLPIPSTDTPRIQEVHMLLGHCLCEIVEATLFERP